MTGELCDQCKCQHFIRFHVPDEAWKKIKPLDIPGGGRLCFECAEKRLKEAGYHLAWMGTIDKWSRQFSERNK